MPNILDLACDSYERQEYKKVCELCDQAASGEYDSFKCHSLWGEALFALRKFKEASNQFMLATRSPAVPKYSEQTSDMFFRSATALAHAGDYEEAAQRYMAGIAASRLRIDLLAKLIGGLDLPQIEHVLSVIQEDFKKAFHVEITDIEELSTLLNNLLSNERAMLGGGLAPEEHSFRVNHLKCSHDVVRVNYITDRKRTSSSEPNQMYGGDRGELEYGFCDVSIPHAHKKGKFESPAILRLEFRENPTRHINLLTVQPVPLERFKHNLQRQMTETSRKEAFVFVHGYNVTFKDAARRAAQLAYDLELTGVPILYSWPSQGRLSRYLTDETNVEWTTAHLKTSLQMLMGSCEIQTLHLIGHSMGNRALTNAVRQMLAESAQRLAPISGHMILTAPDIDRDTFKQFGNDLRGAAQRVTIYASSNDSALHASKIFHGYPRAGDTIPEVLLVNGLDTIDASAVNTSLVGHSYFAADESVLNDLLDLIRDGTAPEKRSRLKTHVANGIRYWSFQD